MFISKLKLAAMLALAASLVSCGGGDGGGTFVLVKVEAGDAPTGIKRIDFALTMGARMRTHMLTRPDGREITPPTEAGFEIDMGTGLLTAAVTAHDASGAVLAEGMGTATVETGKTVTMVVTLARPGAVLALDKTSHDFGTVVIGMNSVTTFRLTNSGAAASGPLTTTVTGAGFAVMADTCAGQNLGAAASCTVDVAFAPGAAAPATGVVTLAGTPGGSAQATLMGTGMQSGALLITPPSQDFGSVVRLMTSPDVTFTVTNTGAVSTGPLSTSLVGVDAAHFTITVDGCAGMALAASTGNCTLRARFNPTMPGPRAVALNVSGDPGGLATAPLSGTGLPPGSLMVTPASRDFGPVVVGMAGATQVFTITNTGGAPTSALTTSLSDSSNFSLTAETCTGTLAAGASCMVSVRFNPAAVGDLLGSLTVTATTGGTAAAALTGRGLSVALLEVTPAATNFGPVTVAGQSATTDLTVTNIGAGMSGSLTTTLVDTTNFTITANTCSAGLAGAASCTITVRFNPQAAMAYSTMLTVAATPGGSDAVQLMGTGLTQGALMVSPSSNAFGTHGLGSTTPATFTVTNMGGAATGIPMAVLSDTTNYQIMSNGCTTALAGGASCMVTVAFNPAVVGGLSGSLTMSATPGGSTPVSLSGTGTATVTVTTQGAGSGTVTSNPAQISCGSTCNGTFSSSPVQLIATPTNAGSVFGSWLGDCAGQGATCTLPLNGNKSATATFARAPGPTTTIITPAQSSTTGRDTSVTWTVPSGVTYSCHLDAGAAGTCTSPAALTGLAGGSHTYYVTGTDSFGNTGPEASRTWTVDATGPVVTISSPTAGEKTGSSPAVSWNTETGGTYSCRLDGGAPAACSSGASIGPLAAGSHSFAVTGTDMYGNQGAATMVTWTVAPFERAVGYSTGMATGVAVGDLNNDGRLDLAVSNYSTANVSVLLQSTISPGVFQSPVNYAAGSNPYAVAIGDLNNDGRMDLAVANFSSTNVSVLLQNPASPGVFQAAANYGAGTNPHSVAIGDLNGDGRLDLVVANYSSPNVSVLLQSSTTAGTFLAAVNYGAGANPYWAAIGDLNGDGRPDLAVANFNSNDVSVLLQNVASPGTFQAATSVAAGTRPRWVDISDLNGDGRLDLAVANMGSNDVSVLLQNPATAGTFQAAVNYAAGTAPYAVTISDLNNDGRPDLSVANSMSSDVSVLLQSSTVRGTFQSAASYGAGTEPWAVATGDLNGDGRLDMAVANFGATSISVILGNPLPNPVAGTLQNAANYAAGSTPLSVATGDLNGDGRLDLALTIYGADSVAVLLQSASTAGSFQPAVTYGTGSQPYQVAIGDLNGDGRLDLATANYAANNVSVLLQSPTTRGTFLAGVPYGAGTGAYAIAIGDLNLDGRPDLAVPNRGSDNVSVLLQSAATRGTFQPAVNYAAGSGPGSVAVADLNGDGRLDIAVGNLSAYNVSVLLQNVAAAGTFQPAVNYGSVGAGSVVTADLNGDGRLDLATTGGGVTNAAVMLQNPASPGAFQAPTYFNAGTEPTAIAVGDLNRDGRPDLAIANYGSANLSVLLQSPTIRGTFQSAANYGAGSNPFGVAIADLNGDGRPDLAGANYGSDNASVLLGQ